METKYLIGLVCLFIAAGASPQTGPAGVGSPANNVLWLKADAGTSTTVNGAAVSAWNDQSGNGINVSQADAARQPLYQATGINGFPVVRFDNVSTAGQNDKLWAPDSPLLDNTSGYSFFTVSQLQSFSEANAIVSKRDNVSIQHSFMLFFWTGSRFNVDIETTNDRFASTQVFGTNTPYLLDVIYDGTLPAASRSKMYIGEDLHRVAAETNASVPDHDSPLLIGSTDLNDNRPFGGDIAEVIIYREALNKASRIIVNNYLSAKYGIALTANDFYAGDLPANGDYDREVAGIGTDTIQPAGTTGSNTAFASSVCGGLGITAVSGFEAGDYVLAGHAFPSNAAIQTDIAGLPGSSACRWQRAWYVDVTNTGPGLSTTIEFDLSDGGVSPGMGSADPADYVLLYRPGQTGSWTQLTTASSIAGDKIRFENYGLGIDGYYTIGSTNCYGSPLPVELLSFTAERLGTDVLLRWETASEQQNDHFTPERSSDGIQYAPVATIAGAGTSTLPHTYSCMDHAPGSGVLYYRLKQTDANGSFTYSEAVSVMPDMESQERFIVYPNPLHADGNLRVQYSGKAETPVSVSITDTYGRNVFECTMLGEELNTQGIRPGILAPGRYAVHFSALNATQVVPVVVE